MKRIVVIVFAVAIAAIAPPRGASAADRVFEFSVRHAMESDLAKARLNKDIGVFMKGQTHPVVKRELGEFKSNKRTNAVGKEKKEACDVAFISALIALQERATREGGDGVVDIVPMVMNIKSESMDNYSCVVGAVMVNVVLKGQVVTFGQ